MIRIQEILDKVAANNHDANLELIQKAYVFAATAHAGQTRLSGEPYLSHPLAVAYTLADMGFDEPTVAAGLLHDTVEDTGTTIEEIDDKFGEDVADIVLNVSGMMKNRHLSKAVQNQGFFEFRKQLEHKCRDKGIQLIVADRFYPSSKLCSCCGNIKKDLKLSDRVYRCECGNMIDRDFQASINLKAYGERFAS